MASTGRMMFSLFLGSLIAASMAVDRGNFKTCDQSGFCKRNRAMNSEKGPFMALLETVKVDDTRLTVELENTKTHVKLNLELTGLNGGMFRVRVTETEPVRTRYEPPIGDVLVSEPKHQKFDAHSEDRSSVTLTINKNQVILQAHPFRIDFIVDQELVMSLNARGLMKFEINKKKPESGVLASVYSWFSQPFRPAGEEEKPEGENQQHEAEQPEEEEPDMYEETFKTHTDSKPHGPSSVGLDFSFPGFENVYGIPEHADSLSLRSTKGGDPYRLYNLDVFEYELNNPMALYGSVPFMIAHNAKKTVGLFWLNAAETWVDIASNTADKNLMSKLANFMMGDNEIPQIDTHWFSESGIMDVFFLCGPTPKDVFQQYALLTGTTALPPLFAISYHQSRWNYNDEQDVANVNEGFDKFNIPMDVIWLDIEHTDGKRYFTWDTDRFPQPVDMIHNLTRYGRKMVSVIDPHLKEDNGYFLYSQANEQSFLIKDKDGQNYEGWCWPGSSGWLDFIDPAVRKFWAEKFLLNEYEGSTLDLFTWNDMNEPSVFNGPEVTMHKDAKHYGDLEHRDVHNIYGMYLPRSTWEGHLLRSEGKLRPFVLSRAAYAGSQRYGAVWTGDNTGEWGHLKMSIPMILSLSVSGITFSGADVGGFFKSPDGELLTRWYQAAAYQPFFRAHAHLDTRRREPWLFEEQYLNAIREALRARYRLLPYWYTLFYINEQTGSPPARPLWVEFPAEKATFNIDDEHLVGPAILVRPVTDSSATGVNVYLPGAGEVWYDADNYKSYYGGQMVYIPVDLMKIPVFLRGGYIVPRKDRARRASTLTYSDPYTLVVALNKRGEANGELYIDDYHSYEYRAAQFAHRRFTYGNNILTNSNANQSGVFKTKAWLERVIIVGATEPSTVTLSASGKHQSLDFTYDSSTRVITIRKPSVNIAEDWSISLK